MNEYHFLLSGLRMVLRTPEPILITDRLQPFLQPPHTQWDCTITVQPVPALPPVPDTGIWHGPECYCHGDETVDIYHCNREQGPVFAVTRLEEKGNVTVEVLPESLSCFAGTSGIFNRIGLETLLLQRHGMLLHASLIKYAGQAVAFAGPSGVGKSTHARIWQTCMGAKLLNGDRAMLRRTDCGWMAYGSPYAGTSGVYCNDQAPLAAIVVLRQAGENRLRQLSATEALRCLYPEISVHHWDGQFVAAIADLCLQLLEQVPVYLLECLPEESAAVLVKKGLNL